MITSGQTEATGPEGLVVRGGRKHRTPVVMKGMSSLLFGSARTTGQACGGEGPLEPRPSFHIPPELLPRRQLPPSILLAVGLTNSRGPRGRRPIRGRWVGPPVLVELVLFRLQK
eukprot:8208241-Pyramimonas_sp.AAC.1